MIEDRKKVGIITGLEARIEMLREMVELIIVIEAENMTVEAGTRIGMIEIVGIEIENQIDLVATIQGVGDHVLAQRIVLEIMIGIGVMEGTECSIEETQFPLWTAQDLDESVLQWRCYILFSLHRSMF